MLRRPFRSWCCIVFVAVGSHAGAQAFLHPPAYGEGALDRFGTALLAVGDLDGDGLCDLAVAAPEADGGTFSGNGVVYVYSAGDPARELGRFAGSSNGERAGAALAAVGDVDGDGVPDLVVGAPDYAGPGGADQGRLELVSGATLTLVATFTLDEASNRLGSALAALGDLDGDGGADLLAGAPGADALAPDGGSALLLGVDAGGMTLRFRFDGDEGGEKLGSSLCGMPDLNGDGIQELVLGSPFRSAGGFGRGRVQVFSGAAALAHPKFRELVGAADLDQFGFAVASMRDPDGSGQPRLVVTSIGTNGAAGGCGVFDVANAALVRSHLGDEANAFLGIGLEVVEDLDGDGVEEVLLGSPFASFGGRFTGGVVELLSGAGDGIPGGSLTRLYRFGGSGNGERRGQAFAVLGDLDRDGGVEIAVGSTGSLEPSSGQPTGSVSVLRSNRPRLGFDRASYQDLDPITLSGLGYATRGVTLLFWCEPGSGWGVPAGPSRPFTVVSGLTADADGAFALSGTLPSANGFSYVVAALALVEDATRPEGHLVSEVASAPVN